MYPNAGLLYVLFVNIAVGATAGTDDGPPDFSSSEYPGQPAERSFEPSYDFCVVGGGTAGLVLGNRLSESGKHTVIVLEAGGPPTDVRTYAPPGANQFGLNGAWSQIDYNIYSVPQKGLNNRTVQYHREYNHDDGVLELTCTGGRCLGGSSATNGLFYGLGSSAIYDDWEANGNPGWGWKDIQASAKMGTKFVGNPNHTNDNTYMTWDPDAYGTKGPLKIAFQGRVPTSNPSFMNAMSAIGVHPTHEQNNGSPLGVKQGTMTLDENFLRSSSFDSYYQASKGRSNLKVLDRAVVSRIIFDSDSTPRGANQSVQAVGVTFLDSPSGVIHNVSCKNEVILAGGAFHSPFILKQSGIGPKDELEQFGIAPVVVNENVGHNMRDHTAFSVIHEIKPEFASIASIQDMTYDTNVVNNAQRDFYAGGSKRWNSKWSATGGTTNGFQQMSNSELESIGAGDIIKANLTNQAHNEFLYESIWYPVFFNKYGGPKPNKSYISVTVSNMAALSKGSVTLMSNQPFTDPLVDNNYLAEEADQRMAIQGVKYIRQIMAHPEIQKWSAGEASPGVDITSDEDILDYARSTIIPNWHASGTCQMLPREKGGVVDSHLRVYGTKGLRVCDVSTFPRLPDINLVGSVFAVAENGAKIIQGEYGDV